VIIVVADESKKIPTSPTLPNNHDSPAVFPIWNGLDAKRLRKAPLRLRHPFHMGQETATETHITLGEAVGQG
jgi:hypothetical protein